MPEATSTVTITDLATSADAAAFRTLNEAWITRYFTLEDEDRVFLSDPVGRVVERGGAVLVARLDDQVVGCIGVVPTTPGVFELVKMAVSPTTRGTAPGGSSSPRRSTGHASSAPAASTWRATRSSPAPCTCTRRSGSGTCARTRSPRARTCGPMCT